MLGAALDHNLSVLQHLSLCIRIPAASQAHTATGHSLSLLFRARGILAGTSDRFGGLPRGALSWCLVGTAVSRLLTEDRSFNTGTIDVSLILMLPLLVLGGGTRIGCRHGYV
jgi:hypothetical protein